MVPVGFTLQPEVESLELCDEVIRSADYLEVAPETTWHEPEPGVLAPNGFHRRFSAFDPPFVAHGVGLSMGSSSRADAGRQRRWLERLRQDQRVFAFRWYTDHLGATALDGEAPTLPLPLPMTAGFAATVRKKLRAMQSVVADVGVENNVAYFLLGDALDEPGFLGRCTKGKGMHVLLDVHNLFTMAENFGFDPRAYLERLPLERVIEVLVSGGSYSDAAWLPGGVVRRLDSHDDAVPEEVWALAEAVVPRCRNLRGLTLERMEGSVEARHVPLLKQELKRLRKLAAR